MYQDVLAKVTFVPEERVVCKIHFWVLSLQGWLFSVVTHLKEIRSKRN